MRTRHGSRPEIGRVAHIFETSAKAGAPYLASEMWASRKARPLPPLPKAHPNPLEGPDFSPANKRQAEGASSLPEAVVKAQPQRQNRLLRIATTHPHPDKPHRFSAKQKSRGSLPGSVLRTKFYGCYRAIAPDSRRRATLTTPSRPVPRSTIEPGSGTAGAAGVIEMSATWFSLTSAPGKPNNCSASVP